MVDAALLKLRAEDRDAVVLRYLLGKTPEEIAWVLGVSEDAARQTKNPEDELLENVLDEEWWADAPAPLRQDVLPDPDFSLLREKSPHVVGVRPHR